MGRSGRGIAALVVMLGGLLPLAVFVAPGAEAAPRKPVAAAVPDPLVVERPRFEPLDASALTVPGIGEFRGSIEVPRSDGGVSVVNDVTLDEYLRGISEVPVTWPLEAQKAQAIAARTYALYELGREVDTAYKAVGADICATQSCQVYTGLTKERRPGSENWNAAVEQTKGQVLIYNGAPIVAKYSSSNGGQSVGGGQPYLRPTDDPDDRYSPLNRWRATYPLVDVARVVGFDASTTEIHRAGDEVVGSRVDGDGNSVEQRIPAANFRSLVNNGFTTPAGLPLPVPSIRFDSGTAGGVVYLDGRGWGHGIGLSQYGALGKALRGLKASDILAAYYSGLRPVSVPAQKLPQQVKVAVALDRGEAVVASSVGHFRIVDAAGAVIAQRASGTWKALPAPDGRVRLVPPPDQVGPPTAALASTEPSAPIAAHGAVIRIALAGPAALTRLTLVLPDGTARELDPLMLRGAGPLTVRLPASTLAVAGTYRLDVERDAGGGRAATSPVAFDLAAPTAEAQPPATALVARTTPIEAAGNDGGRRVFEALATVLLVAVIVAGGFWVGRRPGIEVH